jgi:hypothetical protein
MSDDLPEQRPCQVAFGKLQGEVPGMPDEAAAGLEQALLQARQRPALDGERQDQSTQEIAEVLGDDPEEQPHFVGPEPMTGEPRPVGRGLALLDPLLRRAREAFPQVMLDLGDHPPRPVPGGGLILEAAVADQRGVAGSAAGPDEQIFDGSLHDVIGREPDRVPGTPSFQAS